MRSGSGRVGLFRPLPPPPERRSGRTALALSSGLLLSQRRCRLPPVAIMINYRDLISRESGLHCPSHGAQGTRRHMGGGGRSGAAAAAAAVVGLRGAPWGRAPGPGAPGEGRRGAGNGASSGRGRLVTGGSVFPSR